MGNKSRKTAIDVVSDVPRGTHFCQFYQTKEDLINLLVPYFKAGPENNEFCMPVMSEAFSPKEAKEPLEKQVRDPDDHIAKSDENKLTIVVREYKLKIRRNQNEQADSKEKKEGCWSKNK